MLTQYEEMKILVQVIDEQVKTSGVEATVLMRI
jgi:hypothetical protein